MGVASGSRLGRKREAYKSTLSASDRRIEPRSRPWDTLSDQADFAARVFTSSMPPAM